MNFFRITPGSEIIMTSNVFSLKLTLFQLMMKLLSCRKLRELISF